MPKLFSRVFIQCFSDMLFTAFLFSAFFQWFLPVLSSSVFLIVSQLFFPMFFEYVFTSVRLCLPKCFFSVFALIFPLCVLNVFFRVFCGRVFLAALWHTRWYQMPLYASLSLQNKKTPYYDNQPKKCSLEGSNQWPPLPKIGLMIPKPRKDAYF